MPIIFFMGAYIQGMPIFMACAIGIIIFECNLAVLVLVIIIIITLHHSQSQSTISHETTSSLKRLIMYFYKAYSLVPNLIGAYILENLCGYIK